MIRLATLLPCFLLAVAASPIRGQVTVSTAKHSAAATNGMAARVRLPHSVTFRPTRLLNVHFPEVAIGYRSVFGPAGQQAFEASGGLVLPSPGRRDDFGAGVIGFGLGGALRHYLAPVRHRLIEKYLSVGFELSRAYYRAPIGVAAVEGADYARVVETGAVSRRHEFNLGFGLELSTAYGLTIDFRPAVGVQHIRWDARGGEAAPLAGLIQTSGGDGLNHYVAQGGTGWRAVPRLRVGLGWAW